ncbi:MAG: nickel pincer cofactor biosynthesis protein LarB [Endomicrobia bacterium]|nr:nickel pincer cofactor biosynthesis protein LarB [Endomicrobiia bacterium]
MNLREILKNYKKGKITTKQILSYLQDYPYKKLLHTTLDIHREIRRKVPEIIYCLHKTETQLIDIINNLKKFHNLVIGTKLEKEKYLKIKHKIPPQHIYFEDAKIIAVGKIPKVKKGNILILTAGTTDIPVAEEAKVICELLGSKVYCIYDIGVAGLHRLNEALSYIKKAKVIIVIAGMDGVLPSVVGGLAKVPVIAVPTSTGYGANFNGLAPLLTMLNSCAAGVAVVNIDNGFGAGYIAHLINSNK